jgi:glycosyltransferase involved in cell wall biosynthesis
LEIRPFLNSRQFGGLYKDGNYISKAVSTVLPILKRFRDVLDSRKYDAVFIQREAMIFGPGAIEWLIANLARRTILLDLDDATYVRYISPTYGRLGSAFKFFGKTDRLIRRSQVVVCGNRFIAEYAQGMGTRAVVVPTVADLDVFKPRTSAIEGHPISIGWIGTKSTFPFLESLFPVLSSLAEKHQFVLKIVGSGKSQIEIQNVATEVLEWDLEREVEDFRSLDIGLYPITTSASADSRWINGKSGFKAIQYMAVGVPFVMSPVGVCSEIGVPGRTHFNAESPEDWYNSLDELLSNDHLRSGMGVAGRENALSNYGVLQQADLLAATLESVVRHR